MLLEQRIKIELNKLYESRKLKAKEISMIDAFGDAYEKFKIAEKEAKKLEVIMKENREKILPILEEFKVLGEDFVSASKFVARISRQGSVRESVKYAEILKEVVPKMSPKVRELYDNLKGLNTSYTEVPSSIEAKRIDDMQEDVDFGMGGSLDKVEDNLYSIGGMLSLIKRLAHASL